MKIGILTYHRSENYGAVLQAYALKTFLISKGYNAEFVDYVHPMHKRMYYLYNKNSFKNRPLIGKIKYHISFLLKFRRLYIRKKRFNKFINRHLIASSNTEFQNSKYDLVFYGSDQIWRKQNPIGIDDFNEIYFGSDFIIADRKVSYAASMGILQSSDDDKQKLKKLLKNFDSISVREQDLLQLIQPLTDKKVELVLDPVFLLNQNLWKKIMTKRIVKEKYILLYNLLHNEDAVKCANKIANKYGCRIVEVNGKVKNAIYNKKQSNNTLAPEGFLSLIYNADFVVSTSFHGVAFAILFNIQFYAFLKEHSERIVSLLNHFDLNDRFYPDENKMEKFEKINYQKVNNNLDSNIKKSAEFIINNIKQVE